MGKLILCRRLALAAVACALCACSSDVTEDKPLSINLNGRIFSAIKHSAPAKSWRRRVPAALARMLPPEELPFTLVEFLPAGQTIDHWQELVTVESFEAPRAANTAKFAAAFAAQLEAEHSSTRCTVEDERDKGCVVRWQADAAQQPGDCGVARITLAHDRLCLTQYACLRPTGDDEQKNWLQALDDCHLETLAMHLGKPD